MTLYHIDARISEILARVDENGCLSVESIVELDTLELDRAQTVEHLISAYHEAKSRSAAIDGEVKRLKALAETQANRQESIKSYLLNSMLLRGEERHQTNIGIARIQDNPPGVSIAANFDIGTLPAEFQRVKVEPDKVAIIAAWRANNNHPFPVGVEVKQEKGIRIQ